MITIHGLHTEQDDFNNCGLAVLHPTSAYITEELNGRYDYEIEVPCIHDDPYGNNDSWRHIKKYNILKASNGQLFQINNVQFYTNNGVPYVKAYAPHIWYYLSDMLVYHAEGNESLYYCMENLFTERTRLPEPEVGTTWFSHGAGLTDYDFSNHVTQHYKLYIPPEESDIRRYKYDYISLASAILGNSDSVCNLWNVELHRDNFNWSLMRRKEYTTDGAFYLKYGLNCKEVKFTEDVSKRITEIRMYDNGGDGFANSIRPDAGLFPHQSIWGTYMTYEEPSMDALRQDMWAYWYDASEITYNWEVNYVDFHLTDRETGYERQLRVGDAGTVEDAVGNRSDNVRIISMRTNDITHRVEQIKLGSFKSSNLHQSRWNKKVQATNDTPIGKRCTYLEHNINKEAGQIDNINGDISNINGDISNINGDISNINGNIGNINNSINDINAAIQDIYSKLPPAP
ncbi:MAG: hypothetical protein IKM72_13785 [Oscillospiraceae bacterium]|nr:hypothetical protein [Oscillospiraceae bacterium]